MDMTGGAKKATREKGGCLGQKKEENNLNWYEIAYELTYV